MSGYLARPFRTLRTICCAAGRDNSGRACPTCQVQELCERIERRFGGQADISYLDDTDE